MRFYLIYSRNAAGTKSASEIADGLSDIGHEVVWRLLSAPTDPDWAGEVITEIDNADWVVVIITSTLRGSKVQMKEIVYAQSREKSILVAIAEPSSIPINLLSSPQVDISVKSENVSNYAYKILSSIASLEGLYGDSPAEVKPVNQMEIAEAKVKILGDISSARIFLAYSRKQRYIAQNLYDLLIKNGKPVFWDAKIKAGATWRQTIQKALNDATHLIVIWTPDAAESDEVEREVSYALRKGKIIVPILSKEIPELPYHLDGLHYIVLEDELAKIEVELLKAIVQFSDDEDIWQ